MKETVLGLAVLAAAAWAYVHLPLEWRRHKDIDLGKELIAKIENHQKQHGRLPESGNEAVLKQLGFRYSKETGWQPDYRPQADGGFVLVYESGYRPPYLAWDTRTRQWHLREQ